MPHTTGQYDDKFAGEREAAPDPWYTDFLKRRDEEEKAGKIFGSKLLGDIFETGTTSLLPDIPVIPDFIEDTLFSPIGLASIALAPVTGGGSLFGRAALTAARGGVKPIVYGGVKRVSGELAFGTGSHAVTSLAAEHLPEGTPGALRTGILLGAGVAGGMGGVRLAGKMPVLGFAKTANLPDELARELAKGADAGKAFISGQTDNLSEDTIFTIHKFIDEIAKAQLPLEQQQPYIQMMMNTDELRHASLEHGMITKTAMRVPVLRTVAGFVKPTTNWNTPIATGVEAQSAVRSTIQQQVRVRGQGYEKRFRDATGGLSQTEIVDEAGIVLERFARYKEQYYIDKDGMLQPPSEAGLARDVLLNPHRYDMPAEFEEVVLDFRIALDNDLLPFKATRGADITARPDFAGTQRYTQNAEEIERLYSEARSTKKTTAEHVRHLSLRSAIDDVGLEPKRQSFLQIYMDDAFEEALAFGNWEGERIVRAQAGAPLHGKEQLAVQEELNLRRQIEEYRQTIFGGAYKGPRRKPDKDGTPAGFVAPEREKAKPRTYTDIGTRERGVREMQAAVRLTGRAQERVRTGAEQVRRRQVQYDWTKERYANKTRFIEEKTKGFNESIRALEDELANVQFKQRKTQRGMYKEFEEPYVKPGTQLPLKTVESELVRLESVLGKLREMKQSVSYLNKEAKVRQLVFIEQNLGRMIKKVEQKRDTALRTPSGRRVNAGEFGTFYHSILEESRRMKELQPKQEALLKAMRNVEANKTDYQRAKEFEAALRVAFRKKYTVSENQRLAGMEPGVEEFPFHLAPEGVQPGRIEDGLPTFKKKYRPDETPPEGLPSDNVQMEALRKAHYTHRQNVTTLLEKELELKVAKEGSRIPAHAASEAAAKKYREIIRDLERVHSTLEFGGQTADSVREVMLTADASAFSIQFLAYAMDQPLKATQNIARAVYFILAPEGFRTWATTNANGLADATSSGLNLFDHLSSQVGLTPVGGARAARRPLVESVPAIGPALRTLNDAMYGRGVTYLKYQAWQANSAAMIASKHQKGFRRLVSKATGRAVPEDMSDEAIKRLAAEHTNNTLGGQNMARLGIGKDQTNIEKMLILTPDYLRSTLGLTTAALTQRNAKGALARRVLALYMGTAALSAYTLTSLLSDKEPNILRPDQPGWLQIRVDTKDGGTLNLNPYGRFASVFRPALKTAAVGVETANVEAITNTAFEQTQRYLRGRMASIPSIGTELLKNEDYFGNPIATSEGLGGQLQRVKHLGTGALPISFQSLTQEGASLATASELLGVSAYSTTPQQNAAVDALTAAAIEIGLPQNMIKDAVRAGRNPLFLEDSDGRLLLDSKMRQIALERATEISGLETDIILELGREPRLLSPKQQHAADDAVKKSYIAGLQTIEEQYNIMLHSAEGALEENLTDFNGVREVINQAKADKRAQFDVMFEEDGPFKDYISGLNDPEREKDINEIDFLRRRYFSALFAPEFESIGFNGIEFDFEASEAARHDQIKKIGINRVEQFEAEGDRGMHPIERELQMARAILKPYWEAATILWKRLGGRRLARTAEELRLRNPRASVLQVYDKMLQSQRHILRLKSPPIDQVLVKWYGRQPVVPGRF